MGTSLRELIHKFKSKTLMLLKLLLLEKRVKQNELYYNYYNHRVDEGDIYIRYIIDIVLWISSRAIMYI